jgi:hypothetical protein
MSLHISKMWGSRLDLRFTSASGNNSDSGQLADIRMPQPAACSIYFQAEVISGTGSVNNIFVSLLLGLGRTTVNRTVAYAFQPAAGAPLEVNFPSQPLVSLLANVQGFGTSTVLGQDLVVACTIEVAPITSFPLHDEPMDFGMSVPGEADSLDDDMREDLEHDAPTREEIMEAREPEEPRRIILPKKFRPLVERLTRELGRRPTLHEIKLAEHRYFRAAKPSRWRDRA